MEKVWIRVSKTALRCCLLTYLDTSIDGSDVRTTWVNRLVDTLDPHVTISMEQGTGQGVPEAKVRPPKVTFSWGNFSMEGVVESLTTSYMLFSETGTPIRAKVSVKMKEFEYTRQTPAGGPMSTYSLPKVQVVQVQQGQTLSMLAGAFGTTAQVADANGIGNPLGCGRNHVEDSGILETNELYPDIGVWAATDKQIAA